MGVVEPYQRDVFSWIVKDSMETTMFWTDKNCAGHPIYRGVRRWDGQTSSKALQRRWVVERTFAWLVSCRKLAKDWEKSIQSSTAWTLIVRIRILMRCLARHFHG
jgi:hypothetical protein